MLKKDPFYVENIADVMFDRIEDTIDESKIYFELFALAPDKACII